MMKVVAVVAAYEEEPRVASTLREVMPLVSQTVLVDDGSRDRTADVARDVGAVVLRHTVNRGQGAALKTGTIAALILGADIVVHVDADGQHDPEAIRSLTAPIIQQRADVVFGSRFLGNDLLAMPRRRRMLLLGARSFNRIALGIPRGVTDPQCGLRAMTAEAARSLPFVQDRFAHASEILRLVTRSSLRWQEVPVRVRYATDTLAKGQHALDAASIVWQLVIGAFV